MLCCLCTGAIQRICHDVTDCAVRGHLQEHQDSGEPALCAGGRSLAHAGLAAVQRAALLGLQHARCIAQPGPCDGLQKHCDCPAHLWYDAARPAIPQHFSAICCFWRLSAHTGPAILTQTQSTIAERLCCRPFCSPSCPAHDQAATRDDSGQSLTPGWSVGRLPSARFGAVEVSLPPSGIPTCSSEPCH